MLISLYTTHQKRGFMKTLVNFIKKHFIFFLLLLIITAQCIYLTISFANNKHGFHSDELWNYGFACSSTGTNIFRDNGTSELKNFNSWENSHILYDYITVERSERFDYASVYKNCADDYHPFLGFMMLHFICSLFPGTWSVWYGFALNLLFFIIQQIFLYKLIRSLTGNNYFGIAGVLFFGLTTAAEDILFFLRIYCPATALAVVLMYYMTDIYNHRNDSRLPKSSMIKLGIITLLGCLTLHEFIILAFIAALIYGIYYIFSRHFKLGITFGISMIVSALMSIAIFPATIPHLFGNTGTFGGHVKKYNFMFQFKIYISYMMNDLFGVSPSPWKTMTSTYILYGIVIFLFLFIPFCFIFRHETWLKNFFIHVKNDFFAFIKKFRHFNFAFMPLLFSIIFILAINAKMTSIMNMGRVANRYIMIVYPLMAAFSVSLLYYVLSWLFKKKLVRYIICYSLVIIFSVLSILLAPHCFRFNFPHAGMAIEDIEDNANCIIMLSSPFLLTCTTNTLGTKSHFYATTYETALSADYNDSSIDFSSAPLYLLLDVSTFETNNVGFGGINIDNIAEIKVDPAYDKDEYLDFFKNLDIATTFEHVGTDLNLFGRKVEIYRLN